MEIEPLHHPSAASRLSRRELLKKTGWVVPLIVALPLSATMGYADVGSPAGTCQGTGTSSGEDLLSSGDCASSGSPFD